MRIFISSPDYSNEFSVRKGLAHVTLTAWYKIPGAEVVYGSHSFPERWSWAEKRSSESVYALADDDCLPHPDLNLDEVATLLAHYPLIGILALADVHGNKKRSEIEAAHAVGGIRFIRKGCVTKFPTTFSGCDSEYHQLMVKAGYTAGTWTKYERLHMGVWHSIWQQGDEYKRRCGK